MGYSDDGRKDKQVELYFKNYFQAKGIEQPKSYE